MNLIDFFQQEHPLENELARLEPLTEAHFNALLPIALHKVLWQFTSAKINNEADFRRYFDTALAERKQQFSYPYAIYDKRTHQYVGSTRFANITLPHKRMEIGWTWYAPATQGSGLNKAVKRLMLTYGFEQLALNRIELKTSLLNERSQRAMKRIGAVQEGILRRHMINDNGEVRDTVYFSFIREEWEATKARYFSDTVA